MRLISVYLVFLLISLTWACDSQRVYEKNKDLKNNIWQADSVPIFEFEIRDANKTYNIYFNIRNSISYPFQNLYINYSLEDSIGNVVSSGLHNFNLFDPTTGKPYGSGLGDIFTHQIPALPEYKFDSSGLYRFKIQQFMRMDTLPEILSVGVRVEDTGKGN